jgi:RhtB (resistance to homoserine/threonine) family protein
MDYSIIPYLHQILSICVIAIFVAISPGADFAMITRNSIVYNRKAGIYSALGVSSALWIHVAYSIGGIALIISKSIILFSIIKYVGAMYLIYIGWKTFRSKEDKDKIIQGMVTKHSISNFKAFQIGFITNALNPKATIFFLSIFTQLIDQTTPLYIQIIYGLIISLTHLIWFSLVAILLTHPAVLKQFQKYKKNIERVVGSILVGLGLKVAISTSR